MVVLQVLGEPESKSSSARGWTPIMAVDDELQPREPDAVVRHAGEIEGAVGVADVHHDLDRESGI
jgi:hypothetical protein